MIASEAATDALVFDDEFLRKLERIELTARKMFRGQLRGEHATPRRGRGLDFIDFRRYRPGDDVRHIDWNVYSRLDRLFLKLYAAEEDVTLHLLLDASASMGFGEPAKFDHARRLAAALACIGLNNLDRVHVGAFAEGLVADLPPVKARRHLASVLAFLRALRCGGATDCSRAAREFAARTRSPGLVVLIADLLGAGDPTTAIEALHRHGHEVVVLQVLEESEIDPALAGALRLIDAEDGSVVVATVDEPLRELYRSRLAHRLGALEDCCRRRGIDYLRASTAIAFEDVLLRYLRQGALLG